MPERVAGHWIELLEGELAGWARREEIVEAVLGASSRQEGAARRTAPPFGFSKAVAAHILDLPLGLLTHAGGHELRDELETARQRTG